MTASAALVSIITPVFNAEAYLAESIDSILAQTYPHWELWLLDDGSTDDSPAIMAQYTDPRIRVVRFEDNRGIAARANWALAVAEGTYHLRHDADDVAMPERLAQQVAFLEAHPEVLMVGCNLNPFGTVEDHPFLSQSVVEGQVAHLVCHPTHMLYAACVSGGAWGCSLAYRPAAVRAVGGFGALNSRSEDTWLSVKLLRIGAVTNLPQPLIHYRLHPATVSFQHRQTMIGDGVAACAYFSKWITQLPLSDYQFEHIHASSQRIYNDSSGLSDLSSADRRLLLTFYLTLYQMFQPYLSLSPRSIQQIIRGDLFERCWQLLRSTQATMETLRLWGSFFWRWPLGFYLHPLFQQDVKPALLGASTPSPVLSTVLPQPTGLTSFKPGESVKTEPHPHGSLQ